MRALLAIACVLAGAGLAVAGYVSGSAAATPVFYAGVVLLAAGAGPLWFAAGRGPRALQRAGSALFLLCVLFLILELVWAGLAAFPAPPAPVGFYDYEEARADPEGFRRWWENTRSNRWGERRPDIVMADPSGRNPYVLRPGASSARQESTTRVNERGFRGDEIAVPKGDRFRIVALGESTTFGMTLEREDRTWPEALEERIARDLRCDTPVEVVNAGVPGWTLANQINRFEADIAPLEPDLVVAYHGFNGFVWFLGHLPGIRIDHPPRIPGRPSRLLGQAETALRLHRYRRSVEGAAVSVPVGEAELLRTPYANHYRRLEEVVHAHGAQLALCTFNMAVDTESPDDAIRFYAQMFPDVRGRIAANELHNRIVLALGRREDVIAIDTRPGLDGAYRENYLDMAHFTQTGRERLADNIFAGLRPALREHPRLRCRPRSGTSSAASAALLDEEPGQRR